MPAQSDLSHRNLGADYPVVYAGHGDLVEDQNGNWYVVMLATRRLRTMEVWGADFSGKKLYGRMDGR